MVDSADLSGLVLPEIESEIPDETESQSEGVGGVNELMEHAKMLENEAKRLENIIKEMLPGVSQIITYTTLEKTGENSFQAIEVTSTVDIAGLSEIIQELYQLQVSILWLAQKPESQFNDAQPGAVPSSGENSPRQTYSEDSKDSGNPSQPVLGRPVKQQNINSNQDSDDSGTLAGGQSNGSLN